MSLDELYSEIILDHYRDPRNRGPGSGVHVHHENHLCGDEIDLSVRVENGVVAEARFEGHGCSISQASASMMTEAVRGLTAEQAAGMVETVRSMMHGAPPDRTLGDIQALTGVSRFPLRIKCALLAWMAMGDALRQARGSGDGV